MWTWSLNWGDVTPRIVVGTCPMQPGDLRRIRSEAAVSAVLSLQHDDCHSYWNIDYQAMRRAGEALGLEMMRCPIRDFDVSDMRRCLPRSVPILARLLSQGHRTYVHCTAGLGRAPLTVLAYLILVEGCGPETAIRRVLKARPEAVPAWEAYYGFRADLVARHRSTIERRAYELHETGAYADAQTDWVRAEEEVLRAVLTDGTVPWRPV
ncbi:MAG: dual specificity protein phosphatase family protein [bacterium]